MFETNLHDERFLPFEGAGAVSVWRLALPSPIRLFDYNIIAEAVLHIRYTARRPATRWRASDKNQLVFLVLQYHYGQGCCPQSQAENVAIKSLTSPHDQITSSHWGSRRKISNRNRDGPAKNNLSVSKAV